MESSLEVHQHTAYQKDHEEAVAIRELYDLVITYVFSQLSQKHQEVFVLRHFEGMGPTRISEELGIPIGTVSSRLHYLNRRIRTAFIDLFASQ